VSKNRLCAPSPTGEEQHAATSVPPSQKIKKVTKMLHYLVVVGEGISEFVAGRWNSWKQLTPHVVSAKNSR